MRVYVRIKNAKVESNLKWKAALSQKAALFHHHFDNSGSMLLPLSHRALFVGNSVNSRICSDLRVVRDYRGYPLGITLCCFKILLKPKADSCNICYDFLLLTDANE